MLRLVAIIAIQMAWSVAAPGQSELRQLLDDTVAGDHWIYDDYPKAVAQAKETGKPLLVLFR